MPFVTAHPFVQAVKKTAINVDEKANMPEEAQAISLVAFEADKNVLQENIDSTDRKSSEGPFKIDDSIEYWH